jgi:3-oxoacyl-[acyl-carrier-protein] synthase II
MGEEQCGVDALRIAHARIASGQNDIFLVGGSYNAERSDLLLVYELGGFLWKAPFASVWDRPAQGGGFILGSGAAFLVMEAREHAAARGAKPIATVAAVAADRTKRRPGDVAASLKRMWGEAGASPETAVLSGATGVKGITEEEQGALQELVRSQPRALGDIIGHTMEPQAPAGAAIATGLIASSGADEVMVTSVGHKRGEGLVRLVKPA